jgi:hypothetical protein
LLGWYQLGEQVDLLAGPVPARRAGRPACGAGTCASSASSPVSRSAGSLLAGLAQVPARGPRSWRCTPLRDQGHRVVPTHITSMTSIYEARASMNWSYVQTASTAASRRSIKGPSVPFTKAQLRACPLRCVTYINT